MDNSIKEAGQHSINYPAPLAIVLNELNSESNAFIKFRRLVLAFEVLIQYSAVLAIQNFYLANLGEKYVDTDRNLRHDIKQPTLGQWRGLLKKSLKHFSMHGEELVFPGLYSFIYKNYKSRPKVQSIFSEDKNPKSSTQKLMELRNQLAHGAILPEAESKALVDDNLPLLYEILEQATFLSETQLWYVVRNADNFTEVKPLMGTDYSTSASFSMKLDNPLPESHVIAYNLNTGKYLDLYPLVLYTDCKHLVEFINEDGNKENRVCGQHKVFFFSEKNNDGSIGYLDLEQSHRLQLSDQEASDFLDKFPQPEKGAAKIDRVNWFEAFVNNRILNFVGRKTDQNRINQIIYETDKNALVISGVPGIGKSTLLSKWSDENTSIRHFFREGDDFTLNAVEMFTNLRRQLSDLLGIPFVHLTDTTTAAHRREFDQALDLAAQNTPFCIVIDGLDEVLRKSSTNFDDRFAELLGLLPEPHLLPKGVKLIVSTRPEVLEEYDFKSKFGANSTAYHELGRLSSDEIQEFLLQTYNKYEVITQPDYVQEVIKRSEGNPLYLTMLVEDLNQGRISFGHLRSLPVGIKEYFEKILGFIEHPGKQRISNEEINRLEIFMREKGIQQEEIISLLSSIQSSEYSDSIHLLALFCLVAEPISLQQALDILEMSEENGEVAFEIIRSVLAETGVGVYEIFHASFRDYFLNIKQHEPDRVRKYENIIQAVQSSLLTYCASWEETYSDYALRHYAEHLKEAVALDPRNQERLYALAQNEQYRALQTENLPEEKDLPLRTVRHALLAAIEANHVIQIAEFAIKQADELFSFMLESPLEVLRNSGLEQARKAAKVRESHEFVWLLLIAWELLDMGDGKSAKSILTDAIECRRPDEHEDLITAFLLNMLEEDLAAVWAAEESAAIFEKHKETINLIKIHYPDLLLETSQLVQDTSAELGEFTEIARVIFPSDVRNSLQDYLRTSEGPDQRSILHILLGIRTHQQWEEVFKKQGNSEYWGSDNIATSSLELALLENNIDQAIDSAKQANTINDRYNILLNLGMTYSMVDHLEARQLLDLAMQQMQQYQAEYWQVYATHLLFPILLKNRDFEISNILEKVIPIIDNIGDPFMKVDLLNIPHLISYLDEYGLLERVIEIILDEINDEEDQARCFEKIIHTQVTMGEITNAVELLEAIPETQEYDRIEKELLMMLIDEGYMIDADGVLWNLAIDEERVIDVITFCMEAIEKWRKIALRTEESLAEEISELHNAAIEGLNWFDRMKANYEIAQLTIKSDPQKAQGAYAKALSQIEMPVTAYSPLYFQELINFGMQHGFIDEIYVLVKSLDENKTFLRMVAESEVFSEKYKSQIGNFILASLDIPELSYLFSAQLAKAYPERVEEIAQFFMQSLPGEAKFDED